MLKILFQYYRVVTKAFLLISFLGLTNISVKAQHGAHYFVNHFNDSIKIKNPYFQKGEVFSPVTGSEEINIDKLDTNLLSALIINNINTYRAKRKKNLLAYSPGLDLIAYNYLEIFSPKKFDGRSYDADKINKPLKEVISKTGFKGRIAHLQSHHLPIVDYRGKKAFYYNKRDDETSLKLYSGHKKNSRDTTIIQVPLPLLTYDQFADFALKKIIKGKGKVSIYSKAYTHVSCRVLIIEKTLFRKKIPQAVVIVVYGGKRINFQTPELNAIDPKKLTGK